MLGRVGYRFARVPLEHEISIYEKPAVSWIDTCSANPYPDAMAEHLPPELASKLAELAAKSGRTAGDVLREAVAAYGAEPAGTLDWSQYPVVERVPGRVSGAWVFRDTRLPVAVVCSNLEAGATVEEIAEWFDVAPPPFVL